MERRSFTSVLFLPIFLVFYAREVTASDAAESVLEYASQHVNEYDQDLLQLVAISSISSLPEHAEDIQSASKWLSKRLKAAGLEVSGDQTHDINRSLKPQMILILSDLPRKCSLHL